MSYPAAAGNWSNPPPPGTCRADSEASSTTSYDEYTKKCVDICPTEDTKVKKENHETIPRSHKRHSLSKHHSHSKSRHRRSRSRSHHKHIRRRSRSRSDSSDRESRKAKHSKHRSSKSRQYKHKQSHSRRSRSSSTERRHKRKSRYSRSPSSSDYSSGGRYSRKYRSTRSREQTEAKESSDQDDSGPSQENTFKNDGSFLEMFKKLQEEQAAATTSETNKAPEIIETGKKQPALPTFGKRRGGRILKTGLVQKNKINKEIDEEEPKDAWSIYMKEVKRYKEACCDDDSKTRPLVK